MAPHTASYIIAFTPERGRGKGFYIIMGTMNHHAYTN
jgi:hypothetical protein